MIIILSPAKTLKMEKALNTNLYTEPLFIKEASSLIKELVKYSPPEMEGLMKVNSNLAEQNFIRHISEVIIYIVFGIISLLHILKKNLKSKMTTY